MSIAMGYKFKKTTMHRLYNRQTGISRLVGVELMLTYYLLVRLL